MDLARALIMWMPQWKERGFVKPLPTKKRAKGDLIENVALYRRIAELMESVKVRS